MVTPDRNAIALIPQAELSAEYRTALPHWKAYQEAQAKQFKIRVGQQKQKKAK
jgi:hypothetical protein